MKKAIVSLAAAAALIACLAGCGKDDNARASNTGYRVEGDAYRNGRYYASDDGAVYDGYAPDRMGLLGNVREAADDAADGVRDAGRAMEDAFDGVAG